MVVAVMPSHSLTPRDVPVTAERAWAVPPTKSGTGAGVLVGLLGEARVRRLMSRVITKVSSSGKMAY